MFLVCLLQRDWESEQRSWNKWNEEQNTFVKKVLSLIPLQISSFLFFWLGAFFDQHLSSHDNDTYSPSGTGLTYSNVRTNFASVWHSPGDERKASRSKECPGLLSKRRRRRSFKMHWPRTLSCFDKNVLSPQVAQRRINRHLKAADCQFNVVVISRSNWPVTISWK